MKGVAARLGEPGRDGGGATEGSGRPLRRRCRDIIWVIDVPEANQAVIDFHSWPAPTAGGIRSDASNRKVALVSVRYLADSLSIGSV